MNSLIDLSEQQRELNDVMEAMESRGVEVTKELHQQLAIVVSKSEHSVSNWINLLDVQEKEIERIEQIILEAQAYLTSLKKKHDRSMSRTKSIMQYLGVKSINGLAGKKIWLQNSKRVNIKLEAHELPSHVIKIKTVYEADKTLIKKLIEEGELIDGCELVNNEHVRYK